MTQADPSWRRHNRKGPFDWWLGCKLHGADWKDGCMSCAMAIEHNIELQKRLESEEALNGK